MKAPHLKSYQFQKGRSGNPGGGPKLSDDLKRIKALSVPEVCRLVAKYARMSRADMQTAISDPTTPMIELSIAAIFARCAQHGDYTRLAFLFDRSIGKPADSGEFDGEEDELESMSTSDLIKLVKEKLPEIG